MLSDALQVAFNEQINREIHSAYIYRAMASEMSAQNFPGMTNWMKMQADEEMEHAEKFITFVEDRGNPVIWGAIDKPEADASSPIKAFQAALGHEKKITGHINDLYKMALEEADYASQSLLQWFIDEQVEEEASVGLVVGRLERAGDDGMGLLLIDAELGTRGPETEG